MAFYSWKGVTVLYSIFEDHYGSGYLASSDCLLVLLFCDA